MLYKLRLAFITLPAIMVALVGAVLWSGSGASASAKTPPASTTPVAKSAPSVAQAICGPQFDVVTSPSPGASSGLNAIDAVSASDMWSAGSYVNGGVGVALFEHWNGTQWSTVSGPPTPVAYISDLSARATADVWSVGNYNYNGGIAPIMYHWNGTQWSAVPNPYNSGGSTESGDHYMFGIDSLDATNVWSVGYHYDVTNYMDVPLVLHYDGAQWSSTALSLPGYHGGELQGVDFASGVDAWAVGYANTDTTMVPLALHYDGTQWSVVPVPAGNGGLLNKVKIIGSNDAWAVGFSLSGADNTRLPLTMHWDGSRWSTVATPALTPGTQLVDVSADATNDVWTVGYGGVNGASSEVVMHWNGSQWSQVPTVAGPGSTVGSVSGVVAVSPGNVWVAGQYESAQQFSAVIKRFADPSAFADVPSTNAFYSQVACLVCKGILSGYACGAPNEPCPGNYFHPNDPVTRGQAAKIIANAAGYTDAIPDTRQTFADVPYSNAFWVYVERVYAHGAISGYGCGGAGEACPGLYFRPGVGLTRGQLAKIATYVAGYADNPTTQIFNDVPTNSPFYLPIERAAMHGIISGYRCGAAGEACPGSYFRPATSITRGQAAKITANTFFPNCQTALPESK